MRRIPFKTNLLLYFIQAGDTSSFLQPVLLYPFSASQFLRDFGTNGSGIRVCPRCGFATGHDTILKGNKHETKYGKSCSNPLVSVSLGHEFSTDILKIKIPDYEVKVESADANSTKDQYISILYAILEGASAELDINRTDISGCIGEGNELILFDDTAGGSGFVKQIYLQFERVIKAALHKVSGICGCAEETSCYGCLRNYTTVFSHRIITFSAKSITFSSRRYDHGNSKNCDRHSRHIQSPDPQTIAAGHPAQSGRICPRFHG